jgi:hypothetical protein
MAVARRRSTATANHAVVEERNKLPEQMLWMSVLSLAVKDAVGVKESWLDQHAGHKNIARTWIQSGNIDFTLVCNFAGYEPKYIQRKLKQALENKKKWVLPRNRPSEQ